MAAHALSSDEVHVTGTTCCSVLFRVSTGCLKNHASRCQPGFAGRHCSGWQALLSFYFRFDSSSSESAEHSLIVRRHLESEFRSQSAEVVSKPDSQGLQLVLV